MERVTWIAGGFEGREEGGKGKATCGRAAEWAGSVDAGAADAKCGAAGAAVCERNGRARGAGAADANVETK